MIPSGMAPSNETLSLIRFLIDTGLPHRVTSIARPSDKGSWHSVQGTNGHSLAVDFAGPLPCPEGCEALLRIFRAFAPLEQHLTELIYSGASYSIKNGEKTVVGYGSPAIRNAHNNHVHVAVPLGFDATAIVTPEPKRARQVGAQWLYPNLYVHGQRRSNG